MKASVSLDREERNFFALVTKAVLANPFLEERAEVLAQIVPNLTPESKRPDLRLLAILPALNDRLGQLERKGLRRIKHFGRENRQHVVRTHHSTCSSTCRNMLLLCHMQDGFGT